MAAANRARLGLKDIEAVRACSSAAGSVAMARLQMAMLADAREDQDGEALLNACIHNVAVSDLCPHLLVEMLTNLPSMPVVAKAVVGIVARRLPDHPVARLAGRRGITILKAYDGVDDGERIRIDLGPSDILGDARFGCLLSIEAPVTSFAVCDVVAVQGETIWLAPERGGLLFSENRHVLPPAVLIIAEG